MDALIHGPTACGSSYLPGVLLCCVLGGFGLLLGSFVPGLGGVSSAILLGVLVGNLLHPSAVFRSGIQLCETRLLELSVVFMGFGLSFEVFTRLGFRALFIICLAVFTPLILASFLGRFFKLPRAAVLLIGVGTAICGSSAIAAAAPLMVRDRKDAGMAIGVISILGMIGIFVMPVVVQVMGFDVETAGMLLGSSLHAVGHVVASGFSMGEEIGSLAVTMKMGRVAMLIPLVMFLTMNKSNLGADDKKVNVPWYLLGFLGAAAIVAMDIMPRGMSDFLDLLDTRMLAVAMAAIGLNIRFRNLKGQGGQALLCGVIVWILQIFVLCLFLCFA